MSNWVQYEVWSEDGDGHQELVLTTASRKEALTAAEKEHKETGAIVTVYEETMDGDYGLIKEFS
jgi:hypothetical protein